MPLTQEQKRFNRLMKTASCYRPHIYRTRFVAPVFQEMIRAESGARECDEPYVNADGQLVSVYSPLGAVVCVTCGKLGPWKGEYFGGGTHDAGHFLAGRDASIVFEETGVNCQCKADNDSGSGSQGRYEIWMRHVHGQDEIDRLRRLQNVARQFTLDELVILLIGYKDRLKSAKGQMDV